MYKILRSLLAFIVILFSGNSFAQLVGDNMYLQGRFVEIGLAPNGSLGATRAAPAGYHAHPGGTISAWDPLTCTSASGTLLGSVYDWGHDGWTTGTPNYMGDYTLPGGPWEGWAVQVGTTVNFAYFTNYQSSATGCNGYTNASGAATTATTGAFTSYSSTGGRLVGNWSGTSASGALSIKKEFRVDTLGSSLVMTVVFKNTTATALTDVYYMRALDPDNSQSWTGGSFSTANNIDYQDDYYHRVLVTATATGSASATGTPAVKLGLGTKDCRAKCLIFSSWPMSTSTLLSNVWAGTGSTLGTTYYNGSITSDIAIGLVYNIGTIAPFDSTIISYAYIFNGVAGIDSAFLNPQMLVNGVAHDSISTDTVCTGSTLPVNIINATDKGWSWSHWTWAGPAGTLTSDTGISNSIIGSALTGITTFTITGTDSAMGSCASKVFLLTVVPVSSPPPVVRDTTFCQGITAPALTATGTGLMWYTSATGGVGSATAPVPSTTTLGVFTFWVNQTVSGCTSPRVPINITIAPPPVITLSNNGPLCPGNTLIITLTDTITSTSGITYSWNGPAGFTAATQNVTLPGVTVANAGVYTVVVNNNGCATYPTFDTVVINPTPPSPVFTNPTYCQYLTSVPLTATGTNVLWYTNATGGVGSPTGPTPSTALPGVFTWYVTQTINGCESLRYPVTVTVNAKPVVPVITNNPGSYCPGQPFNTYTIVLGSNILWYTNPTGGTGTTTPPVVNTSVPGTYINYASQTVLGCESDRTAITVTVYNQVLANYNYTIHYGCHGDTVLFANTSTGAINFQWDFGDGTSSILPNPTHIYANQGIYTVKLFAHSANCVDSIIQTINLVHLDSAAFTLAPAIVCQGLPVTFTDASVATGPSYLWNFGDGNVSTTQNPNHTYVNTGVYNVSLIVTDFVPCMDTAYGTVFVDSLGPMTMTMSDTAICQGSHITFNADYTTIGSTEFVWDFGNGDSIKNVDPVIYAYGTAGVFTVSGTVRYRACPTTSVSGVVHVYDQPDLYVGNDFSICEGSSSVTLMDNINGANPAASWLWNTGATTSSISVGATGTYFVTVSLGGCTATDSVLVNNDCDMGIVNAFTPNGDGINDYFNPRLYMGEGLKTFSMQIYNRWGEKIFDTKAIDGRGWDGYYNAVLQPQEVYVYFIDATFIDGKKINKHGNLTLLR